MDAYIAFIIHFAQTYKNDDIARCIRVSYCYQYDVRIDKRRVKITRLILRIFIHASSCVLNFLLPACTPNSAKVNPHHIQG